EDEARDRLEVGLGVDELLELVALVVARERLVAQHPERRVGQALHHDARSVGRARHRCAQAEDGGGNPEGARHGVAGWASGWFSGAGWLPGSGWPSGGGWPSGAG